MENIYRVLRQGLLTSEGLFFRGCFLNLISSLTFSLYFHSKIGCQYQNKPKLLDNFLKDFNVMPRCPTPTLLGTCLNNLMKSLKKYTKIYNFKPV